MIIIDHIIFENERLFENKPLPIRVFTARNKI